MYYHATPPSADHARWDRWRERRSLVTLEHSGDILFGDHVWPLATGKESERRASLEAFRSEVERRCADPSLRTTSGRCQLPLMLNADQCVGWENVRDVLRYVLESSARIHRLQWTVRGPPGSWPMCQEADVLVLAPRDAPDEERPPRIEIGGRRIRDHVWEVRLLIGDRSWTSVYSGAEEDLRPSFATWREAGPHLRAMADTHDVVELHIHEPASGISWAHVVQVFDLLIGAGLRDVDLPEFSARFSLAAPEDRSAPPFAFSDDPVVTPLVVGLSALVILLVFALTFAPLRATRPPSRSRRRL